MTLAPFSLVNISLCACLRARSIRVEDPISGMLSTAALNAARSVWSLNLWCGGVDESKDIKLLTDFLKRVRN